MDWADFRVYRVSATGPALVYHGTLAAAPTDGSGESVASLRNEALTSGQTLVVKDVQRDARITAPNPAVGSMVIHPIRFGEELLGTLEVDHPKRHAYGTKDLLALSTLANQMATAIHIAELRRPLLSTVEQIGLQVTALARVTESPGLRPRARRASHGMRKKVRTSWESS